MATPRLVPQRELRNRTADVLREVEAGSTIRITVNGRPVADLTPIRRRARFVGREVLDRLFELPDDPGWAELRRELRTDEPDDPWSAAKA
ncbi:MAG: type II toxin-antitoxin system prevent-host-death family antitoxin [Solirubrobacteraceae bacterium]